MDKALIVIDAQNDYLSDGRFPLWNIDTTLEHISNKISEERTGDIVIFIQHLSPQGAAFLMKQQMVVKLSLNSLAYLQAI